MKLLSLKLTNYLSHGETDLELQDLAGPILLLGRYEGGSEGESNGSGKSAVLESVLWGLYGESRARTDDDLIRLGEDDMAVTIRFRMSEKDYEVIRGKKRGKSQHLTLTNVTDDVKLSGNSVRETQAKIASVLGVEAPVFVNSVFCRQNDLGGFAGDTPARRKEILAEILQLARYSLHEQKAKDLAESYNKDATSLESAVTRAESELAADTVGEKDLTEAEGSLATAQEDLTAAQSEVEGTRLALTDAKTRAGEGDRIKRDLTRVEDDIRRNKVQLDSVKQREDDEHVKLKAEEKRLGVDADKAERLTAAIAEVDGKIKDIGSLAEKLSDLKEKRGSLIAEKGGVITQRDRIAVDLDKLRKRLAQVQGLGSKCPMCESELVEEKRLAIEAGIVAEGQELRKEFDGFKSRVEQMEKDFQFVETQISEVDKTASAQRDLERDRRRLDQDLTNSKMAKTLFDKIPERSSEITDRHKEQADELTKEKGILEGRLKTLVGERDMSVDESENIKDLSVKLIDQDTKVKRLTTSKDGFVQAIGRIKERMKAAEKRRSQAAADKARAADARASEAIYRELVRGFGKNGIPALIMDNALAEMQEEVKTRVDQLSRGRIQVEFTTQRELKTGKQQETLDIRVSDEVGTRDFSLYSGGEKMRVAVSIRLALARIMSRRAGKKLEAVFIDEVSDLDPAGLSAFADMVQDLAGEFSQVFVVSHLDELKSRFANLIVVVKDRDGSHVEKEAVFA